MCSYGPHRLTARTICRTFRFFLPVPVLFGRPLNRQVDAGVPSACASDVLERGFGLLAGVVTSVAGAYVAISSVASAT